MIKVVAISGKARHGKDTVAEMLFEHLSDQGYRVLITHYADLLKFICRNYFGWDGAKDEAGRHILQFVGTDVVRKQKPDYWVDFVIDMLSLFKDHWDYVIIPDTRFPNEIDKLRRRKFDTTHLRVVRPNYDAGLSQEQMSHPSETALDAVRADIYLKNDGTLEDLRNAVNQLFKEKPND